MGINLDELLDIDAADPAIIAARHDRANYRKLIAGLVQLRNERQMTQADVAASMGTTQSVISAFEQAVNDARFSTVQRYCRAVGARLHAWHEIDGGRAVQTFTVRTADDSATAFYAAASGGQ